MGGWRGHGAPPPLWKRDPFMSPFNKQPIPCLPLLPNPSKYCWWKSRVLLDPSELVQVRVGRPAEGRSVTRSDLATQL